MDFEKDIFDLIREESENLTEAPPTEAWQRLETRLKTTRKQKRKRRPMQLQLVGVIVSVLLLIIIGVVSWYVTFQHQERLRGERIFSQFSFLNGKWVYNDKKTKDIIDWSMPDSLHLVGEKYVYFENLKLSKMPIILKNLGRDNVFIFNNKTYVLKEIVNETFIFETVTKEHQQVRLRKASNERFTLSFGEGIIFVFKKDNKTSY